ncbi:MAG TPA: biotin--[acetyl-CoA-carboxylase] ligase [Pyrinomonadaceae bacterium]|nr:biotin--[acetyl-CoA-carboxylase] ligase [Pyrinomonadaceae bacterium]
MKTPLRPVILRFDSLPSTNTEAARQAAAGAAEGLCVVAREQTRGRGRRERVWVSPADAGLYLSIVLRPAALAPEAWPLITLAAALAVREALAQTFGLEADIKWPNDIIAGERKLCGILAETVETGTGRAVILGIGVNLDDRAFPPELKETAASVASLTGRAPAAETLLQSLLGALSRRYALLQSENGAREIISDWSRHSSYAHGRRVRVSLPAETFDGRTRGLEPDGALRVETDQGEIRIVRAGDITSLRTSAED